VASSSVANGAVLARCSSNLWPIVLSLSVSCSHLDDLLPASGIISPFRVERTVGNITWVGRRWQDFRLRSLNWWVATHFFDEPDLRLLQSTKVWQLVAYASPLSSWAEGWTAVAVRLLDVVTGDSKDLRSHSSSFFG